MYRWTDQERTPHADSIERRLQSLDRRPLLQPIVVQEFGRRSVAPPRPMPLTQGETVLLVVMGLWALLGLGCLAYVLGQCLMQIVSWLR